MTAVVNYVELVKQSINKLLNILLIWLQTMCVYVAYWRHSRINKVFNIKI
jgi:hypothetical protein